jgi:hypothetical protein
MSIRHICRQDVDTAGPSENIYEVARRMRDRQVGTLVVVDAVSPSTASRSPPALRAEAPSGHASHLPACLTAGTGRRPSGRRATLEEPARRLCT